MSPPRGSAHESGRRSQVAADAFITEGLDPATLSADHLLVAMDAGNLVTWRRRTRSKALDLSVLHVSGIPGRGLGLRILAPLSQYRQAGRAAAEIRRILEHPGYRAAFGPLQ